MGDALPDGRPERNRALPPPRANAILPASRMRIFPEMTTIDVRLPEPMNAWVQRRVESGLYEDVSDYVRDLIRRDQGRAGFDMGASRLGAFVAAGLADAEAGRVFDAEEVFDELDAKYAAMREPVNLG